MTRQLFGHGGDNSGAVAPTVALSLVALIAVGGIAFDYARLASLDTELQNAADQAALAAASQLDKKAGACSRANAAAQTLVANQTRFANDGNASGLAVTIPSEATCDATGNVRFYQNKQKTLAATSDANARFVEITVNSRRANYALTPIAGAFSSGALAATAFAGMGSAVCKIPPFMICNPNPGTPFDADAWRGKGLKLFQGGGNSWAAGNFGYLDVGAASNGTPDQRIAVAMDNPNINCVSNDSGVAVDTGVSATVMDALNTRFDIYQNGWPRNTCHPSASCSPAFNVTKDVVRASLPSGVNQCGMQNSEWRLPADNDQYIPSNNAGDDSNVTHMGYPMDVCHYPSAGKSCGGTNQRFGDGVWRRDIYFKTTSTLSDATGSNWQAATGLGANASRYDFYRWEQNVAGVGNGNGSRPEYTRGGLTHYGRPVCKPPGLAPSATQPDRRVFAAAVGENCAQLSGASNSLVVGSWIEIFLVQPSIDRGSGPSKRTDATDIYVEIIGRANPTGSGASAQVVYRDVPYLIE